MTATYTAQRVIQHRSRAGEYGKSDALLTTGNGYVDLMAVDCLAFASKALTVTAVTNTLTVNVLGSTDDGATYAVALGSGDATTSTPYTLLTTAAVTHIKVQIKPKVNDVHGTGQAFISMV